MRVIEPNNPASQFISVEFRNPNANPPRIEKLLNLGKKPVRRALNEDVDPPGAAKAPPRIKADGCRVASL
jgi:hypothetical protein